MATQLKTDRSQWIGGKSVDSRSNEAIVIRDPANGEPFAAVARGCAEDAAAAVEAAQRQRRSWAD